MKELTVTQEKMRVKKLVAIKEQLTSNDEAVVLKAIKEIKKHGDSSILTALVEVYKRFEDTEVRNAITSMFRSLKDPAAGLALLELAEKEDGDEMRSLLLSSIWESGLNVGSNLKRLVELSTKSDYQSILDIMTIVDNLDDQFDNELMEESLKVIQDHLTHAPKDDRAGLWVTISRSLSEKLIG